MNMTPILAALYLLCMLFLLAFGIYVLVQDPHAKTNRLFAWLAVSLLGWVGTLFAFSLVVSPIPLLWIGRANFAAMVLVVPLTYLFTRDVANRPIQKPFLLWIEAGLLAALTAFTPWIDRREAINAAGVHITTFGFLFPVYIVHVIIYFAGVVNTSFSPTIRVQHLRRMQLTTLGIGILATALIALVTNLLLPYFYGDFSFINVGTVSTILFLAAAGYAVFAEHLFKLHLIIRATFIYAGFIALALEVYDLVLNFLARLLPLGNSSERSFAATVVVLIISAFTQQPISRWLGRLLGTRDRA